MCNNALSPSELLSACLCGWLPHTGGVDVHNKAKCMKVVSIASFFGGCFWFIVLLLLILRVEERSHISSVVWKRYVRHSVSTAAPTITASNNKLIINEPRKGSQ